MEKGRLDAGAREAAVGRLHATGELAELADAALVVEAIVEDPAVKRRLFADLEEVVGDDTVLATNTSSLSVTAIAGACGCPAGSSDCTSSTRRRCSRWSRSSAASPPTRTSPRARTRR